MSDDVLQWLASHGLERFAPVFLENEVDLTTLAMLGEDDLKELGLPFGPRKRILKALAGESRPETREMAGDRRQVTALFCDMVGFTALSQRIDPEELQLVIQRYEDACAACVTRFEGYVYQRLGDGIVAIFGFPRTHEGEAERAIRAGLRIIETIAALEVPEAGTLQVRIGIASGIVVVGPGEQNLVGDTMNLAARLEAAAEPGTVVVSSTVRQLARGGFEFEDLGALSLKGIAEPTRAYRVLGAIDATTRFDAAQMQLTAMVGRDAEFGALLSCWDEVEQTGSGRAALLCGEPGIGKSRLLDALRSELARREVAAIPLQCSPFHTNSAYYPIIAHLERALKFHRAEPAEERLERLERLVVERSGQPRESVRYLAAIMSLPFQERYGPIAVGPRRAKEETIGLLVGLLTVQAQTRAGLVLFEDLHWADPSTLELLDALFQRLAGIPIMVLGTHRPEFGHDWARHERLRTVALERLSADQCGALVQEVAGGMAVPPALVRQIADRADGVPLFVEELTKTVLEAGALTADGDGFVPSSSAAPVTVPGTLRDLLMARLDQVSPVKRVAQIGACVGREFSYELIAALDVIAEPELSESLSKLTSLGLAFRRGQGASAVYTFKHALVQEAAGDSMLRRERRMLHARIAEVLEALWPETCEAEPEVLARHLTEAESAERAVRYWEKAGGAAVRRFALPEAIAYLRKGMEQIATVPGSADRDLLELGLRKQLGPLVVAQHGWGNGEIARVLEPALALAERLEHWPSFVPILNTLSIHYFSICDMPGSLSSALKLLEAGAASGEEDLTIVGERAASAAYFWMGDFGRAQEHGDAVRRVYDPERHWHLAQTTNIDPFSGEGVYRGQYLWMMGYPDQARAASDEKDANARRRNHPFDLAFALTLGAQLFDYLREPEALLERTEEAARVGRQYGLALLSEVMVQISRGVALVRAGELAEGASTLEDAMARLAATGHRVWLSYLRAVRAEALALAGDPAEAMRIVDASLAHYRQSGERAHYAEVQRLKGWVHLRLGQPEATERHLRAAIDTARAQGARSWELRAATTLAGHLAERGERQAARALLSDVYGWFSEGFDTRDLIEARALLDRLGGRREAVPADSA